MKTRRGTAHTRSQIAAHDAQQQSSISNEGRREQKRRRRRHQHQNRVESNESGQALPLGWSERHSAGVPRGHPRVQPRVTRGQTTDQKIHRCAFRGSLEKNEPAQERKTRGRGRHARRERERRIEGERGNGEREREQFLFGGECSGELIGGGGELGRAAIGSEVGRGAGRGSRKGKELDRLERARARTTHSTLSSISQHGETGMGKMLLAAPGNGGYTYGAAEKSESNRGTHRALRPESNNARCRRRPGAVRESARSERVR